MILHKIDSPIDEKIIADGAAAPGFRRRDEDELLVEQMLDRQSRRQRRAIHDGEIQRSLDQSLAQLGRGARRRRQRDAGNFRPQSRRPLHQKTVPKTERRADRNVLRMLICKGNLKLRLLPDAHQSQCMLLKEFPRAGQFDARLRSRKQRSPEQIFETFDARGDGGLSDVELASGINEAARFSNNQKCASEIDVHRLRTSPLR